MILVFCIMHRYTLYVTTYTITPYVLHHTTVYHTCYITCRNICYNIHCYTAHVIPYTVTLHTVTLHTLHSSKLSVWHKWNRFWSFQKKSKSWASQVFTEYSILNRISNFQGSCLFNNWVASLQWLTHWTATS